MKNLELMRQRLNHQGGPTQQERMIKDKRWTLDRTVLYSYQGASVAHLGVDEDIKALINPNKLKPDYDDKIISVGFEYNFAPGDIFEWKNTDTKWLIYLQDLTELAYFRGDIRKCNYEVQWKDDEGNIQSTYLAVRGPVETKINFIQKNGISVDEPNHSLNILMPKTDSILKYFKRYSKFYLQGNPVCWRVEATDSISMPGILEITAVEYYSNEDTDDVENGIVNGLVIAPIPPTPSDSEIQGDVFIKPQMTYKYIYTGDDESSWYYDNKLPIESEVTGKMITIKWLKTYTGQFVLKYGDKEKTIVVESLF